MLSRDQAAAVAGLRRITLVLRIALGLFIVPAALSVLYGLSLLAFEMRAGFGYAYAFTLSPLILSALALGLVVFPLALWWLFKARANLPRLMLDDLRYSPAWTVGSFFVPGANLVVPVRSVTELYNRSQGEDAWQAMTQVSAVSSWWTLFVAGSLVCGFLAVETAIDVLTNIVWIVPTGVNTALGTAGIAMLAAAGILLFILAGQITEAQERLTGIGDTFA